MKVFNLLKNVYSQINYVLWLFLPFRYETRSEKEVLNDLAKLIHSPGYIYTLCMLLIENSYVNLDAIHKVDSHKRLNINEVALLLGFLTQQKIDYTTPENPDVIIKKKQQTRELLNELHQSISVPSFVSFLKRKLRQNLIWGWKKQKDDDPDGREFFASGRSLREVFFYGDTGVYDFQYTDFLDKKYQYDKEWLESNRGFRFDEVKNILQSIKQVQEKKWSAINIKFLSHDLSNVEDFDSIKKEMRGKYENIDYDKEFEELLPMIEFWQYSDLFFPKGGYSSTDPDSIREEGWQSFYQGLLDLFTITKEDCYRSTKNGNIRYFFQNFSMPDGGNEYSVKIGGRNLAREKPLIELSNDRYFLPDLFLLYESVYESPYYWMVKDKNYKDKLEKNRWYASEDIVYDFLRDIFGDSRTFRDVKVIKGKEGKGTKTDIDILCLLGSRALCVQVKSKKLTLPAQEGDDAAIMNDFEKGVQKAYKKQGLVSRKAVLDKDARFIDAYGKEIKLSSEIKDAYILGVTMENFSALNHTVRFMLDKKADDPYPLFITIFDLEILAHYLKNPYDFLYYIRQRTELFEYFFADSEISFLGFHLTQKLWKDDEATMVMLDNYYAKIVDQDYVPRRKGIKVAKKNNPLRQTWYNEDFVKLRDHVETINYPCATDIIFSLLDLGSDAREALVKYMKVMKDKTKKDGNRHDFTLPPDDEIKIPHPGLTFISFGSTNVEQSAEFLAKFCELRKYKCKSNAWIGFGCTKNCNQPFNIAILLESKWEYSSQLEEAVNTLLKDGTPVKI